MPEEEKNLSKTMRIDLIPDTPMEPVVEKKKRVVIATPTRKHRKVHTVVHRRTDSHYDELLQSVYDAALIADLDGRIVDVNVRAIEFLHYEREELCSLEIFDVISGADQSLIDTLCENLENERFTLIQAYCLRKDGSFFPSEIAVNNLHLESMHLCFFLRDITVRRQAEEMLRTEHNAIQNSGSGIAVVDLEAKLEYLNPSVATMWGYESPDDLMGQDVRLLLSDQEAATDMINAVMGGQQAWTGEMRASRNGQGEFDVQVSGTCNRNTDGEVVGIVFSFVDISDRRRAEDALMEAERHRVMLESLGAACHHLGQPATVLLANLGIIKTRLTGKTDDTTQDLLKSSIEAADALSGILHKLNAVNEYKTTQYLEHGDGAEAPESRILDI
jgi:PAS domain S-box-containing protein